MRRLSRQYPTIRRDCGPPVYVFQKLPTALAPITLMQLTCKRRWIEQKAGRKKETTNEEGRKEVGHNR